MNEAALNEADEELVAATPVVQVSPSAEEVCVPSQTSGQRQRKTRDEARYSDLAERSSTRAIVPQMAERYGRWLMKSRRGVANRIGGVAGALSVLLAGCATERPYTPPALKFAPAWSSANVPTSPTVSASFSRNEGWWTSLNDPAIDVLVDAALVDSPTLAKAVGRIDEARASVGMTTAHRLPSVGAAANLTRSRSLDAHNPGDQTILTNSASFGPSLTWELLISDEPQ